VGATSAVIAPDASSAEPIANPSFIDINYAEQSRQYASAVGIEEGSGVDLVGFVSRTRSKPQGTFELSRFYISCCAADAVPYAVAVDPGAPREVSEDTWFEVNG
jgi:putative membrane protein